MVLWEIMSYGQTPYDDIMDNQEVGVSPINFSIDDLYLLHYPHVWNAGKGR